MRYLGVRYAVCGMPWYAVCGMRYAMVCGMRYAVCHGMRYAMVCGMRYAVCLTLVCSTALTGQGRRSQCAPPTRALVQLQRAASQRPRPEHSCELALPPGRTHKAHSWPRKCTLGWRRAASLGSRRQACREARRGESV